MNYDLYCYRSYLGKPDQEEADSVIETDMDKWAKKERNAATKLAIVQALTAHNSQLEAIDFDYEDIAKLTPTIIEEAGKKFDHIEINYKSQRIIQGHERIY
jgi:hypothetical protein